MSPLCFRHITLLVQVLVHEASKWDDDPIGSGDGHESSSGSIEVSKEVVLSVATLIVLFLWEEHCPVEASFKNLR